MNKKCQVFTPKDKVIELLDAAGYKQDLYGRKVIENACGDGSILKEIVRRYIKDSILQKRDGVEIKFGLEQDIYGAEIDNKHYTNCIENLDEVANEFGIANVKWNILNVDFLKCYEEGKYDFVIGNPPYITYRELDEKTRAYLADKYESCERGKFDYCYAFIEASIRSLKGDGHLAYLIPNSIFKNVYAKQLRDMILPNMVKIIDYTTQKLFDKALTSSAILVCQKGVNAMEFEYYDVVKEKKCKIDKSNLEEKWVFSEHKNEKKVKRRFGDYFKASISIATLSNDVYIFKDYLEEDNFIVINDNRIEKCLVRKGVSPRSLNYQKEEMILFPYMYVNGNLKRFSVEDFEEKFPNAVEYLKVHFEKLDNRKADGSVHWFEYGRTQALAHLNQEKLLLSTVITQTVKVYEIKENQIPYSGIYVVPINNMPLSKAKKILESKDFLDYVKKIGINANGNSLRITVKDINNYMF